MNQRPSDVDYYGTKYWLNSERQYHRDNDLPAVICSYCGWCEWYQNGKQHRDNNLPARICSDGDCEWWIDGKWIKREQCTPEEAKEYKKPYYQQKRFIKASRFEKIIK